MPLYGVGTAQGVGSCNNPGSNPANIFTTGASSPFSGSVDPDDGNGFDTGKFHLPNFSWGTENYPLAGGATQNGVHFNVSTVGAKNIIVRYNSRVSATASDYERLQYTTNGTDWVDYPASSTFAGIGTTYRFYTNDLTGFPGVANNPDFAFRIVTEFQSTATYGITPNANYLGTANTSGTGGTVTYDLVKVMGDAITNNNAAPVISGFVDTNTVDYIPLTLNFTVSDDSTAPDDLVYSATPLNMIGATAGNPIAPGFVFGGSGPNRILTINPNSIPDSADASPILVTATDANGDTSSAWFLLTVGSQNLPPTNSFAGLKVTNVLANTSITIPFKVGDDQTLVSALIYSTNSDNNTVIPATNIVINGLGSANPSVTITPGTNQLGVALVSIGVTDTGIDLAMDDQKTTTTSFIVMVRPNTNVVADDYFNYDASGALDTVSAGFWNHLSGNFGTMRVGNASGVNAVTVDSASGVTENLQVALVGAPYRTNSGATLYASFIVNLDPAMDPLSMPRGNGTYFAMFNDGSGNTANVEGCVVAATNGAAPGLYRLGINNGVGGNALTAQMFPMDLSPGSNYVVVTALSLTNGFSTLWINPSGVTSPSVTDPTLPAYGPASTNNMSNFEFRQSGQPNGGLVYASFLKVGTSFDAVFPSLQRSVKPGLM